MKKIKGTIDISALNTPPEKHEYEAAKFFMNRGKNIVFIKPSNIKGCHTPDFLMDGKLWELKTPIVFSKSSFEDNLKKALKQSVHIIYDLRRLKISDEKVYQRELKNRAKSRKIKTLLIISKDGQLLTPKEGSGKIKA